MLDFGTFMNTLADLIILVCFVSALVFVISYVGFFFWRKTKAGRALMYVFLAWISVTVIAGLTRFVGPHYWGREWFRVIGWSLVAFALINLIRVLWYNFRKGIPPLSMQVKSDTSEIEVHSDKKGDPDVRH